MPTSVPGSRRGNCRGFTLVELLVVFAIVALGIGLVALALPDRDAGKLEEEGARLGSLLEMARAEARVAGVPVRWVPRVDGATGKGGASDSAERVDFEFVGLPRSLQLPRRWLDSRTRVVLAGPPFVLLGPEAILPPQSLVLQLGEHRLTLATDGLGPFEQAGIDVVGSAGLEATSGSR